MEIVLYHENYDVEESLDNFLTVLYSSQMKYLASDLLQEGLSTSDIKSAVQRAMTIGESSRINVRQHFMPVYTHTRNGVIQDCKLSKLGYAMVLLNARPELRMVGEWQLKVLRNFLG